MNETYWLTVAIILATILGPVLAVYASDIRAEHRKISDRKDYVFHTLWATRGARMQFEHVSALNRIELAFPRSSHPLVVDAWELYLKHLDTDQGDTQDSFDRWSEKANDLFLELMHIMANDLGIPLSKTSTKYNAYYPKGYAFTEGQQNELRALLLELLKNERSIKMKASITPGETEEEIKSFLAMQQLWKHFLGGETLIPVRVEKENSEEDSK